MANVLDYQLTMDPSNLMASTQKATAGLGTLSDKFAVVTDNVSEFGDKIMGIGNEIEGGIKSVLGLGTGFEKLTGMSLGLNKQLKIMSGMNLKQMATYGLLQKHYGKTAKVFDKLVLGHGKMNKILLTAHTRYRNVKDVAFALGDYFQAEGSKYVEKITNHWESLAAAIISTEAAMKGFQFGDRFTEMSKSINLSDKAMKELQASAMQISRAVGKTPEELAGMLEHIYKQGIRDPKVIEDIAIASHKLEVSTGAAADETSRLFTRLVGLDQLKPGQLEKISSGIVALKDVSSATADAILDMGDTVSSVMLRVGRYGTKTEDVMGALATTVAMTEGVFADSKEMEQYYSTLADLSEGGIEQANKLTSVLAALGRQVSTDQVRALITGGKFDVLTQELAAGISSVDKSISQLQMQRLSQDLGFNFDTLAKLSLGYKKNQLQMKEVQAAWSGAIGSSDALNAAMEKQNKTIGRMSERLKAAADRIHTNFGMAMAKITRPVVEFSHKISSGILDKLEQIPPEAQMAAAGMSLLVATPVAAWAAKTAGKFVLVNGSVATANQLFEAFPAVSKKFVKAMYFMTGETNFFTKSTYEAGKATRYFIKPEMGGWLFKEAGWKTAERGLGVVNRGLSAFADIGGKLARGAAGAFGAKFEKGVIANAKEVGFLGKAFNKVSEQMLSFSKGTSTMEKATARAAETVLEYRKSLSGGFFKKVGTELADIGKWVWKWVKKIPGMDFVSKIFEPMGSGLWNVVKGFYSKFFGILGDAAKAVNGVFKKWLIDTGLLSKAFTGVKAILGKIAGVFFFVFDIATAITLAVYGIAFALKWVNKGLAFLSDVFDALPGYIAKAADVISNIIPWIGDMFVSMIADIPKMIIGAFAYAGKEGGWSLVTNFLALVFVKLPIGLLKIVGAVMLGIGKVIIKGLLYLLYLPFKLIPTIIGAVYDLLNGAIDFVKYTMLAAYDYIIEIIDMGPSKVFDAIWEAGANAFSALGDYIADWGQSIHDWIADKWSDLVDSFIVMGLKIKKLGANLLLQFDTANEIDKQINDIENKKLIAAEKLAKVNERIANEKKRALGIDKSAVQFMKGWTGGKAITARDAGIGWTTLGKASGMGGAQYSPTAEVGSSMGSTSINPSRSNAQNQALLNSYNKAAGSADETASNTGAAVDKLDLIHKGIMALVEASGSKVGNSSSNVFLGGISAKNEAARLGARG